jgi:hypothetical protein
MAIIKEQQRHRFGRRSERVRQRMRADPLPKALLFVIGYSLAG